MYKSKFEKLKRQKEENMTQQEVMEVISENIEELREYNSKTKLRINT